MSAIVLKDFSKLCRPYQDTGTTFLYEHDEALLLLRMGGGKTIITLSAITELLAADIIKNVLIVAPLAVCNNTWKSEHLGWSHTKHLDVGVATGSLGHRIKVFNAEHTITVVNYDTLQWVAKYLQHQTWDLIVLDEVTRFKNPSGKRYRAFKPFLERAKMSWGLTGSLAADNLEDIFNPVRAIDLGAALGSTIGPFRREYFTKATFGFDMIPGSAPLVAGKIAHLCYQPDPAVYQSQLPEIVVQRHTFELSPECETIYSDLCTEFVAEVKDQVIDVASAGVLVNKLQQVASGFLYNEDGEAIVIDDYDRLDLLRELLAQAEGEPVLIWYWYECTGAMLRSMGYVDLLPNLDAWNRGEIPVAIAHPRSGGHGINAQAGGSRMIWYEHTWSAEERAQAIARLHRQGQKSQTVYVHDICGERNGFAAIDASLLDAQDKKEGVARAVYKKLLGV